MPGDFGGFFVDWLGYLWYGPMAGGRYKRFEGVDPVTLRKLWKEYPITSDLRLSRCPFLRAKAMVDLYVADAKKRGA